MAAQIGFLFSLDNSQFSDVCVLIGDKKICAHKIILSARSPVFAAMFAIGTNNIVNIVDADYDVFKAMVQFIYTGKSPANLASKAKELLVLADKVSKYEANCYYY